MKQKFLDKIVGIVTILLLFGNVQAQTLVNKEWEQLNGIPDSIAFSTSVLDNQGNLIVTSNAITAGQQANLLVMKYDRDGNLLWQDVYNGAFNGKDYGIAIITDNANNVYVAGASQTGAISSDYIIRKYNSMGTLQWSATYSGSGTYNAPTAITVDNSGNVYVTGVTFSFSTQTDYATLKLSSSGVQQWLATYNYANLYDVPAGIEVNTSTGTLYVTGASASSNNNYDYATVEYDATNGNQLNVNRVTAPGTGFDKATAIERDNTGNLYITGSAFNQNTNSYDIKTIKLNASLAVQWIQTYDKAGLEDIGTCIDVDNVGNVFVGGYVSTIDEGRNFITLKYDSSGNLLWAEDYNYNAASQNDEIRKLDVDNFGNIFVAGFISNNTDKDILLIKYTSDGGIKLMQKYEFSASNGADEATDIETNNQGDIYITGKVFDGANHQNAMVKYSTSDEVEIAELDSLGKPLYVKNQLIVGFNPSVILTSTIDNTDIQWGTPDKFLSPAALNELQSKIPYNISRAKVVKIFQEITTQHTHSITRLGDTITNPHFWASLIIEIPANLPQYEEFILADSIATLDIVEYAHPNMIAALHYNHPDDPFYDYSAIGNQSSLYNSSQNNNFDPANPNNPNYTGPAPDNGIHAEEAWDTSTSEEYVRTGVIDTGIGITHPDFQTNTGSIIAQGYDLVYNNNLSLSLNPDGHIPVQHGSKVCGIIAAGRNNGIGIAGVAGGNLSLLADKQGTSLYVIKIIEVNGAGQVVAGATISDLSAAIQKCVAKDMNDPNIGYGVHVLNMSLGYDEGSLPYTTNDVFSNYSIFRKAIHFANRNNVTLVASRGNDGNQTHNYPSTFPDKWVVSVGGSNAQNGTHQKTSDYEDANFVSWATNYGKDMDVLAPSVYSMIYTTSANAYSHFAQTSAAAPHVTGEVGLLMGYHNPPPTPGNEFPYENLAPEDVEELIQRSADLYNTAQVNNGYTNEDGFGKINAYKALQLLELPKAIKHFGFTSDITNSDISLFPIAGVATVELTNYSYNVETQEVFKPGIYAVQVVEVSKTTNHVLAANETIIDAWARHSASTTLPDYIHTAPLVGILDPVEQIDISNVTPTSASFVGYCYRLGHEITPGSYAWDGWIPVNPYNPQANTIEYTLYTTTGTVSLENLGLIEEARVFPNPANNSNTIEFLTKHETEITIEMYDIQGRKLKEIGNMKSHAGRNQFINNISAIPSGVYFYKLISSNATEIIKFIKI